MHKPSALQDTNSIIDDGEENASAVDGILIVKATIPKKRVLIPDAENVLISYPYL